MLTYTKTVLAAMAFWLLGFAGQAHAHDIPPEMRVHAFVKPDGDRAQLLIRIPLALLLNLDLPKQGPGYLDLAHVEPHLARAIEATGREIDLLEDGQRLPLARGIARISLPSDRGFESFDSALALLQGPRLPDSTYVFWNQGYFDAYLEYPIRSARSSFSFRFNAAPGLGDRLKVDLRYISPEGTVRAYELHGGADLLALDPRWHQAAWSFIKSGFSHILDGTDHLLFLLCLILPFRRADWRLLGVITAFTLGHSVTLIAAAYGAMPPGDWFPPLIEFFIAASILYMAIENVLRPDTRQRWLLAGLFGLVHGFGFSFLLQSQLQFAGSHLLLSLLAFNIGIELGQLLVLAVTMPLLVVAYRRWSGQERIISGIVGLLVGHTAWHWMTERLGALQQADWSFVDTPVFELLSWLAFSIAAAALCIRIIVRLQHRKRQLRREPS